MSAPLTIRPLTGIPELEACVALQKATWGEDFDDVVSAATMLVTQKVGGLVAGAFTADGSMVGILYGLTGVRDGHLVHWSHMLAIKKEYQNRGLGQRMKHYQRDWCLERAITRMYWTFDPLESRNAYFNLNRLGVSIDAYERDLYGSGASSILHQGLGTDRFVVLWHLDAESSAPLPPPLTPLVIASEGGYPVIHDFPAAETVRLEIPTDIQALKRETPEAALAWREATRRVFLHYLDEGYTVDGFYRDQGRSFYVLGHKDTKTQRTP